MSEKQWIGVVKMARKVNSVALFRYFCALFLNDENNSFKCSY
jgi:hypothetical protein